MRQYTINNEFIYNESLRELTSLRDKKVLKITLMRARCLSYLFENAYNALITREMIARAVWGERSQFVSDANLTQLLYLLRRDLQQIGLFELFITLPRQGIKIDERFIINATDLPPQMLKTPPHRYNKFISMGVSIVFLLMILFFLAPFI
ncbi:transcriptional regulator [Salmonella enterica subsp. salamae]|nr:transcriptional regulator [Salmonella enterica subsp. salamae]ECJ2279750.1 transcriptional regulator [Salmonella enterica subsp. salamae]HCC0887426.1 transcriptional regulator [Salmonella enterica]